MITQKEIIKKIEDNKKKIRSFGVSEISLIGSYARDEANSDSDIDFIVDFEPNRGLFDDYVHLIQFLKKLLKKEVDLGEKNLIRKELKSSILRGGKIEAKI